MCDVVINTMPIDRTPPLPPTNTGGGVKNFYIYGCLVRSARPVRFSAIMAVSFNISPSPASMTKTNETTKLILADLYKRQIFAYRNSVGAISTPHGFYQMGKTGSSDVIAILPPRGRFLGIEIKTGKDRLRPAQIGFIRNVELMGGLTMTVKSFEDYTQQLVHILSLTNPQ